ncbi:accessory gene regulator B family protein [Paenibacillus sp. NRS-1775]|uniref:accessory gene regulator B family protein n=1 Tax=unclassified Paenibacillus TaxID=185978 RepID=UPI003D28C08A
MKNKTVTDVVAYKITDKIIKSDFKNYFPDREDTLHVSRFILSNILPIIIIMIIGISMGNLSNTFYALLGFSLLRMVSGGYHIKNADTCFLVSVVLLVVLGFTPELPANILNVIRLISFLIVMVFSPYNIENNTVVEKNKHVYFKYLSMLFVLGSFFIVSSVFVVSIFIQSLTLINLTGKEVRD